MDPIANAKTLAGPFTFFEGSFKIEFLDPPPSIDSSVLMKATYVAGHPLNQKQRMHPQTPPFHIHFDQSETFRVIQGRLGTTFGWDAKHRIYTKEDADYEVKPYVPHTFWPLADQTEDCIALFWAHPKDSPEAMDHVFFQVFLAIFSDAYEAGKGLPLLQLMVTQHESGSALVVFPRAWWLGPLRWYPLFVLQGVIAAFGRALGYKPLPDKYLKKQL